MQFAVGYQLPEPDADEKPLTRIVQVLASQGVSAPSQPG